MNIHHVIPAQAEIQFIERYLHSGTKPGLCLLRRSSIYLDSRPRGNDAVLLMEFFK